MTRKKNDKGKAKEVTVAIIKIEIVHGLSSNRSHGYLVTKKKDHFGESISVKIVGLFSQEVLIIWHVGQNGHRFV